MKHFRFFLMAVLILSLSTTSNAQSTNAKKSNATSKHVHKATFQCPMKCEGDKTYAKAGKCPVCNMKLTKAPTAATAVSYQCPMKCEGDKTYAKEGKCPECNMNLKKSVVKKPEQAHKHS